MLRQTLERCAWAAAAMAAAAGGMVASAPATAASAAPVVVSGTYRIVSTDCYFGGSCSTTEHLVQSGEHLRGAGDPSLRGLVVGDHVKLNYLVSCCNEDNWYLKGRTGDGGRIIRGTMTDGLDGSGTFTMTRVGP